MSKFLAILLLLVCSLSASAIPGVGVETQLCEVSTKLGEDTGYIVGANDKEVLCMTAAHSIDTFDKEVAVKWMDGAKKQGKIVAVDREADLAAFTVSNSGIKNPVLLGDTNPTDGALNAVGFSAKGLFRVSGEYLDSFPGKFEFKGKALDKMSGGPVVNRNGIVVGQVVGTRKINGEDRTTAVSGQVIQKFLLPYVGGVVRIGDPADDPSLHLTALRRTAQPVRVLQRTNDTLNQCPKFNFPRFGACPPTVQSTVVNTSNSGGNSNNVNNDAILDIQNQLDVLFLQMQTINVQASQPGPPGPAGPAGAPGVNGVDGKPGNDGAAGTAPEINVDQIVTQVLSKQSPFKVNFLGADGKPASTQEVKPGGELNIPPVKLWWRTLNDTVLKTAQPLGEPIKMKSVEEKKK